MRRTMLVTLMAALLAGCATSPASRLGLERQHDLGAPVAAAVPAPLIRVIPGYSGPAPTVTVTASVPDAAAALDSQEVTASLVATDADTEALDLLADDTSSYAVQGFFGDIADAIKRTVQRWRLTKAVKKALKHKNERAFELHEGEIDNIRKNRTAPVTKINNLAGGLKEIVSTWTSSNRGTYDIETRRVIDADGVTQTITVSQEGTNKKGQSIDLSRVRTLLNADGTYQVVSKMTLTYKDGRADYQEWKKTVKADGSELIEGYINHRDGFRTEISGTRDTDGKVHVEVSKITPMHNPSPMPPPTPTPSASPSASPSPAT